MQASTSRNKSRPSGHSHNFSRVRQYQAGLFRIGLSGSEGRKPTGITTGGPTFSHLLNKELSVKSPFIDLNTVSLAEIFILIKSIEKCLKFVPGYKDKKKWNHYPTLIELADYMVAQVRKVIPSGYERWHIAKVEDKEVIRYVKYISGLGDMNIIPLEWLPELKKQNHKLHELVLGIIWKVSRAACISCGLFEFDEYFVDDPGILDNYDDDEEGLNIARTDILKYKKGGVVQQYIKEMKSFGDYYTDEVAIEMILNFKPKGTLEKKIKQWLNLAIGVLKNPPNIDNYILLTDEDKDYNDGEQLSIYATIGFAWSYYDRVAKSTEDWRNDIYGNSGMADHGVYGEYNSKEHIKPYSVDEIKPLLLFMKAGREIYFDYYDKPINDFYDRRDNQPRDN